MALTTPQNAPPLPDPAAPTTAMKPKAAVPTAPTVQMSQSAPASMTATNTAVNAPTDTVQGQMTGLLDPNSDIMKRAQTNATQQMNRRGVLNSSMTAGATTAAMIDKALPIAQADAGEYSLTRRAGDQATNQAAATNVGNEQQSSIENTKALNAGALQTQSIQGKADQADQLVQNQLALDSAQQQGRETLQAYEMQTQQMLADAGYAKEEMSQTMSATKHANEMMMKHWDAINQMPNLSPAARDNLLGELKTLHQNNLDAIAQLTGVQLAWSGTGVGPDTTGTAAATPPPPPPATPTPPPQTALQRAQARYANTPMGRN